MRQNNIEPLLVAVRRTSRTITHVETVDPKEFKKTKEDQKKNEWTAKRMHGQFVRDLEDKDKSNIWRWTRKSDLKGCIEALTCSSAQELSIRTNYIKYNIEKTGKSPLCRMCGTRNETISNIVSECGQLAQKEYKPGFLRGYQVPLYRILPPSKIFFNISPLKDCCLDWQCFLN